MLEYHQKLAASTMLLKTGTVFDQSILTVLTIACALRDESFASKGMV